MTYGNGLQIKYVYDALDRILEVQYNVGEGGAVAHTRMMRGATVP